MFGWTPRDLRVAPETAVRPLRYRAEVCCRDGEQSNDLHVYDGGDYSPYCIESLLDLLRSEARSPRRALDMTFDILGPCSALRLQEVAARFARASIAGLSVTVRASGHPPVRVGDCPSTGKQSSAPAPIVRSS
jgi:hypothetical protein